MRSGRDTALQIATRSNRTGDDEKAHQQACAEADIVIVTEKREYLTRR